MAAIFRASDATGTNLVSVEWSGGDNRDIWTSSNGGLTWNNQTATNPAANAFNSQWNRAQEADGSIPFIYTKLLFFSVTQDSRSRYSANRYRTWRYSFGSFAASLTACRPARGGVRNGPDRLARDVALPRVGLRLVAESLGHDMCRPLSMVSVPCRPRMP